jgi:hydroxymethylbilane synthase
MTTTVIRIVTRESPLALWQAEHVAGRLRSAHPGIRVEINGITTEADRFLDRPLAAIGGKGMFVKELEQALLEGRADIAVHSVKDVPVTLPAGLELPVILAREDVRDVLVCTAHAGLHALPAGARVGTSSLRRRCQLLHRRPDLHVVEVRGNVETRLAKLDRGEFDALILAAAGMLRLGLAARIREYLPVEHMLPAIGQGALGIECRSGGGAVRSLIAPLADAPSAACIAAERAVNHRLGGNCHAPIAGHAVIANGVLRLSALVGRVDGSALLRRRIEGPAAAAGSLGDELGRHLLDGGAAAFLEGVANGPGA